MKTVIDPGKKRRTINFIDHICFSHVKDLAGEPLDLQMSIMIQNGNSEMRLASGWDDEASKDLHPVILWINGAGWRGPDKNIMVPELVYLAEAGYAVVSIDYRSSAQGKWPCQLIDCKTAVRFLRANAEKYALDPNRIGTFGRSAGGQLSAWMGLNTDGFDSEEYAGYSSHVQCAVDMFGCVDLTELNRITKHEIETIPNHRWKKLEDSHGGALMGGDMSTLIERSPAASPVNFINEKATPLAIIHGDQDPLVPLSISEDYYARLCAAGFEQQTEFYVVKNGGHGTRELFQEEVRALILNFFNRYLK